MIFFWLLYLPIATTFSLLLDFSFFLQLSHKLGQLNELKIICLPQKTYKELDIDVCTIIDNLIGVNK